MITLNGKETAIRDSMTVAELLVEMKFRKNLVAVEYNGQIPPKSDLDKIILKDGDILEVVSFMGGG